VIYINGVAVVVVCFLCWWSRRKQHVLAERSGRRGAQARLGRVPTGTVRSAGRGRFQRMHTSRAREVESVTNGYYIT